MQTTAMLSTGVKITVDSSDIDVKFTKSIEQLNKERPTRRRWIWVFASWLGIAHEGRTGENYRSRLVGRDV